MKRIYIRDAEQISLQQPLSEGVDVGPRVLPRALCAGRRSRLPPMALAGREPPAGQDPQAGAGHWPRDRRQDGHRDPRRHPRRHGAGLHGEYGAHPRAAVPRWRADAEPHALHAIDAQHHCRAARHPLRGARIQHHLLAQGSLVRPGPAGCLHAVPRGGSPHGAGRRVRRADPLLLYPAPADRLPRGGGTGAGFGGGRVAAAHGRRPRCAVRGGRHAHPLPADRRRPVRTALGGACRGGHCTGGACGNPDGSGRQSGERSLLRDLRFAAAARAYLRSATGTCSAPGTRPRPTASMRRRTVSAGASSRPRSAAVPRRSATAAPQALAVLNQRGGKHYSLVILRALCGD